MSTTLRDIPVERVSEEPKRRGFADDRRVDMSIEDSLGDVARRISDKAEKRGLTEAILAEILAERA